MQRGCKADLLIERKLSEFGWITCLSKATTARKTVKGRPRSLLQFVKIGLFEAKVAFYEPQIRSFICQKLIQSSNNFEII